MKERATYKQLQQTLLELKEKGLTTIPCNASYEILEAELARIINTAYQTRLYFRGFGDEPEPINPLKTDTDETEDDEPKANTSDRPNKPKPGTDDGSFVELVGDCITPPPPRVIRIRSKRHPAIVPVPRLGARLTQLVDRGVFTA